jgi:hypothetical protein
MLSSLNATSGTNLIILITNGKKNQTSTLHNLSLASHHLSADEIQNYSTTKCMFWK